MRIHDTRLLGIAALGMMVLMMPAQAGGKEMVIDAADLAPPELRSDEPVSGKWWLRRDVQAWGAPKGMILMTGRAAGPGSTGHEGVTPAERFVPYRVPPLVVNPKASGWHRIHVGLYHQPDDPPARLLARLSKEPYPEYLQTPQHTQGQVAEVCWKAADLTGSQIIFEQPPAPLPHPGYGWVGGITHLRLAPLTDAEVAAGRKEIELPPTRQRLFGMLDYTDEVFWWGSAETEEDIRAIAYRHRQAGFGRIYWRCFGTHLDNSLAVPEAAPRWTEADEQRWCQRQNSKSGWMPYIHLEKKFDPLKVAVEYGRNNDCEVHAWVRFTNFNREPRANFWHEHPEFYAQMLATETDPKTGKRTPVKPYRRTPYPRVMSLAYPEVRDFYLKFFKQIASTGTKGIMIDLLRHPPIAGYEPIVAEAFQKKYGSEMEARDVYHDPLIQEHLSQYLRLFLVELRKAVGPEMEISVRCSGPSKYALRGKEWVAEG
ncbi:MAG: hypothetical protein FJ272_18115, partial [Planctomycetes bacterium]|nr:hypothetical protein [Planctomycetota bacterium]